MPTDTPTPPSPEPPREREGETWTRIHSLIDGAVTEGTMDDDDAQRFHREVNALAAASLPPSAGTMEPEYVDGAELLRRIRHEPLLRAAYNLGRYDFGRQQPSSAPSAGSGGTELDRLTAYIAGFIEAIDAKPDDDGYAEAVAYATEKASAWLAAHPAGPTRAEEGEWIVHNHGTGEGPGLACREYRVNGRLLGACLLRPATPTTEEPPHA